MKERMKGRMKERMNERTKERLKEKMKKRIKERKNERKKDEKTISHNNCFKKKYEGFVKCVLLLQGNRSDQLRIIKLCNIKSI